MKDCCALCKSYSCTKTGPERASGWCMRRRLSVSSGFWCAQFTKSSPVRYAQEAHQVQISNDTVWD